MELTDELELFLDLQDRRNSMNTYLPRWQENAGNGSQTDLKEAVTLAGGATETLTFNLTKTPVVGTTAYTTATDIVNFLVSILFGGTHAGDISIEYFRGVDVNGTVVYETESDATNRTFTITSTISVTKSLIIPVVEAAHVQLKIINGDSAESVTLNVHAAYRQWREQKGTAGELIPGIDPNSN